MRTLIEEFVAAQSVAQIVVSPGFVRCAALDRLLIDQDVHHSQIALEIMCLGVGARQACWCEGDVMLCRYRRAMPKPCLQFEQSHRLACVEELARNRRARAVAADRSTGIGTRDTGLAAEHGNQSTVQVRS